MSLHPRGETTCTQFCAELLQECIPYNERRYPGWQSKWHYSTSVPDEDESFDESHVKQGRQQQCTKQKGLLKIITFNYSIPYVSPNKETLQLGCTATWSQNIVLFVLYMRDHSMDIIHVSCLPLGIKVNHILIMCIMYEPHHNMISSKGLTKV